MEVMKCMTSSNTGCHKRQDAKILASSKFQNTQYIKNKISQKRTSEHFRIHGKNLGRVQHFNIQNVSNSEGHVFAWKPAAGSASFAGCASRTG
jgi:hypothetical protein